MNTIGRSPTCLQKRCFSLPYVFGWLMITIFTLINFFIENFLFTALITKDREETEKFIGSRTIENITIIAAKWLSLFHAYDI